MRALYESLLMAGSTAPIHAVRWFERHAWVEDHPGWTFEMYDGAKAGDILRHEDFLKMRREAERQALEEARAEAERHG